MKEFEFSKKAEIYKKEFFRGLEMVEMVNKHHKKDKVKAGNDTCDKDRFVQRNELKMFIGGINHEGTLMSKNLPIKNFLAKKIGIESLESSEEGAAEEMVNGDLKVHKGHKNSNILKMIEEIEKRSSFNVVKNPKKENASIVKEIKGGDLTVKNSVVCVIEKSLINQNVENSERGVNMNEDQFSEKKEETMVNTQKENTSDQNCFKETYKHNESILSFVDKEKANDKVALEKEIFFDASFAEEEKSSDKSSVEKEVFFEASFVDNEVATDKSSVEKEVFFEASFAEDEKSNDKSSLEKEVFFEASLNDNDIAIDNYTANNSILSDKSIHIIEKVSNLSLDTERYLEKDVEIIKEESEEEIFYDCKSSLDLIGTQQNEIDFKVSDIQPCKKAKASAFEKVDEKFDSSKFIKYNSLNEEEKILLALYCCKKIKQRSGTSKIMKFFGVIKRFFTREKVKYFDEKSINPFAFEIIKYIRENLLGQEGIFRINGKAAHYTPISCSMGRGEVFNISSYDPFTICSILKAYVREILDGLIPTSTIKTMVRYVDTKRDDLKDYVNIYFPFALPEDQRNLLVAIFDLFKEVDRYSLENKMTIENLIKIWPPTLFPAIAAPDLASIIKLIEILRNLLKLDYENIPMELYKKATEKK